VPCHRLQVITDRHACDESTRKELQISDFSQDAADHSPRFINWKHTHSAKWSDIRLPKVASSFHWFLHWWLALGLDRILTAEGLEA